MKKVNKASKLSNTSSQLKFDKERGTQCSNRHISNKRRSQIDDGNWHSLHEKKRQYWLYGKHTVLAALNNPSRTVINLLVSDAAKSLVSSTKHQFKLVSNDYISNQIKQGQAVHQGVAALVSPIKQPLLDTIVAASKAKTRSTIIALDQITDPHNIGAIMRSAAAFGADAIIAPKHNSPEESSSIAKISSGAIEIIPFIHVSNLSNSLGYLQKEAYWIVGLDGTAKDDVSKLAGFDKLVIVLGSEGHGIRRLTASHCDMLVKISIQNIESLNVSAAAAIALYTQSR